MFHYVYILQSSKNNSFYIGYTTDLRKRFHKHNAGENKATKPYIPFKLIFYEAFLNRVDAKHREEYLKGGYGRKTINALLKKHLHS
jgi:putative endonuclease